MNSTVLWKVVNVLVMLGVSGVGADEVSVSVMEGDSVILYTDIEANQQEKIRWYFNDIQIAVVFRDLREICTDECKERFRDRLKLDHQTGSLAIINITNTDSGDYILKVFNSGSFSDKIFSVSLHDAPERYKMKGKSVKEGESLTLDPGLVRQPNEVMRWYYNDIVIAEITGYLSEICTDDQCDEIFRDRLKLDHQTGSLTITNTRTTDSGLYHLEISNSNFRISRISTELMVIGSGLSPGAIAGIVAVVLSLMAAVTVVFIHCKWRARRKRTQNNDDQRSNLEDLPRDQSTTSFINASNGTANGNHVGH